MEKATPREKEVLDHLLKGMSNREIAVQMRISELTVKGYLRDLYRKFHIQGRGRLTLAYAQGKLNESNLACQPADSTKR